MYYFASDVHLGAGSEQEARRTEQAFLRWLDMAAADAEAIFLVGDIFDFWFEYGHVIPKGFVRTLGKFAELTDKGIEIKLFTGNHDMWCRDYLQKECGVEVIFSAGNYNLSGKNIFIAHGDNMNIGDKPMLRLMNSCFRSKVLRVIFSWLIHPDILLCFGKWWSNKSRQSHPKPSTIESLDFLVDYALSHKQTDPSTDIALFGHLHLGHTTRRDGLQIVFLSDWTDDEVSYATLNSRGEIKLNTFNR